MKMKNFGAKVKKALRNGGVLGLIVTTKNYIVFKLNGGKIRKMVEPQKLGKRLVPEPKKTLGVDAREKLVEKAVTDGRKVALYFVENDISPQFRYRCQNVLEATQESKKWQAVYFFETEFEKVKKWLPKCDLVVIERQSAWEGHAHEVADLCRTQGVRLLYDVDDLVFDLKDVKLLLKSINARNFAYWGRYVVGVRRIAKKADGFITTNEFLGQKLQESFGLPYKVVRNSLNREQVEASELCARKIKRSDEEFRIGYFSGSPTHEKDFQLVMPDLVRFLKAHDKAVVDIVGYMRFEGEMEDLANAGRIRFWPQVDFVMLQQLMREVDVNIAPLVVNDFTNCKSELKFFEAGVVETTTVASPSFVFRRAINDGVNGFLAKPGEWYKKLEFLYENPEENRKMAKRAREDSLKNYYGPEFLKEVEAAYEYFAK